MRKVFFFSLDLIRQILSGKLKDKMTPNSSSTGEVTLEQVDFSGRGSCHLNTHIIVAHQF